MKKLLRRLSRLFSHRRIWVLVVLTVVTTGIIFVTRFGLQKYKNKQTTTRDTYLSQARAAEVARNYSQAEDLFLKALALPNVPTTVWRELGYTYQEDHKTTEAISAYQKSVAGNQTDPFTWNVLGNLYRDTKQYDLAEAAYQKSISQDPRVPIVVINLSQLYVLKGDTSKAIIVVSDRYNDTRQMADLGLRLAYLYQITNQKDLAKATLDRVLVADPDNIRAQSMEKSL